MPTTTGICPIRAPALENYFDPILRKPVHTPRRARQLSVTFNIETLDVPG